MSISWYMKVINEKMARKFNKEDKCKGHFWEGRYVSKPILDEAGLIACMAYIDLNPVRANMTDSIENSKYTSIFKRIKQKRNYGLCPMSDELSQKSKDIGKSFVPCNKDDYIKLVRETSKIIREDKDT